MAEAADEGVFCFLHTALAVLMRRLVLYKYRASVCCFTCICLLFYLYLSVILLVSVLLFYLYLSVILLAFVCYFTCICSLFYLHLSVVLLVSVCCFTCICLLFYLDLFCCFTCICLLFYLHLLCVAFYPAVEAVECCKKKY
jgi:hypothetical protein